MSHRQPAGRHGDGSPEDEEFNGAHVSPHGDGTEEHDQIVFTQSTEAPWPSSASVEGDHPEHLDTPHAAAFTPSYLTSPALTAQTAETLVTSDSEGGWSLLPTNRMSVQTALTPVGLSDASTITGSEHSHRKAPAPGWQSFSQAFQPALQGAAHDSLTVRDITPPAISSEGFDATDFASQSSISRSRLPTLYSEPDFEGISLQSKPFRRPPRSQRSSNASSTTTRRAPGLLTPMPNRRGRATRIFADPLAAPSADLDFGLPSIRHIIDSDDGIDGGINPEQPTAFKDNALVNHLEEFQREATARWDKTKGASEHDREIIVSDLVTRLWQTSVNYLAEILRANKKIRQLATAHRVSLGEVHKLRQYSQDTIEREEEREHNLTLDLDRLREENKRLHRELTLRDLSIAKSVTTEEESLRIGYWIQNQPFVPNSSSQVDKNDQPPETLEEEGKPDVKVGETPKQELKQWSDFAPPLKEEPWKEKRRESWEPNHEDVVEMLRKIKQLRDDVEHEKFMKGAAEEMVVQLEKELDQAHGSEAVDESSAVGDVQSTAAKRIAEIVGARAALKTSQQNYEKAQEECALLQKTCDGLEETIAEKDHRILILERDLKEAQKDLAQERGELMDAMLKIEDMETQLAECQKQLHSKTSEVSQLEYQVGVLIPDLNTTQAEREDLRHKNAVLEEKNYDLITDNVYKLQCAEHEETLRKLKEAELQEAKDELAEERIDYEASRIDFANNIRDLEESISEYKAEQDELRKQIDKHRTMVGELEVAISFRDLDLQIQRETIQELRQSNKSTMAAAKGLAEYPKSLRGEEGQQRFEELRRRCRRLKEQQVRWQREIREMAGKWLRAQLRYRHDHRALTKAYRDLERLQQQRHFDAERERLQLDQIASLEQECEDARLALQDAHLRLASAEEIGKTHDGEIEDVEGILPLGQDVPKDGETETVVDLSHTALPLPPVIQERIVTRERVVTREVKVEHHHSEACFCSLVEYWFPGALQTVLPRRQDTDDSGYGSGSVDGHDDSQGLGGTPENHDVPNDEDLEEYIPDPEVEEIPNESDRALHTYLHSPTDSADDAQPSPTTEKFPHEPTAQGFVIEQESTSSDEETCNNSPTQEDNENQDSNNAGFDDLEGPSLRGGAGSPDDTSTEPSAADYEVQMASFITKDDGWGGDEAEEPVEKEEDAVSETSFGPYQEQLDDDILYGSDDDLQTQSVEEDEDTAATPRPKFSRRTRPSIFEQFTESDEDTPATPRPKSSPKARQAGFEVIPAPRRRKFSRKPRQASLEDEDVTESDDDAFGLGLAQEHGDPSKVQPLAADPASGQSLKRKITEIELDEVDDFIEDLMQTAPSNIRVRSTRPSDASSSNAEASAADESTAQPQEPEEQQEPLQQEPLQQEPLQQEPLQQDAQPEEAQQAKPQKAKPQKAEPPQHQDTQPPQPGPRPRRKARRVTFVTDPDPVADLLNLINTDIHIPTPEPEDDGILDDIATHARLARHYYHGHTTTDGPFQGPVHLVCQLLTALAWLVMLVLAQPGNVLSTFAILAGYFILPLRFILRRALYYLLHLPAYHLERWTRWIFRRPPPQGRLQKLAWPVLGRPSAAGMVSSVVALGIAFLIVAVQALVYEREIWARPNRWTDAYLRDIVYRRPYPWWSPLEVDFRLAAMKWVRWKVNVVVFKERYLRTW